MTQAQMLRGHIRWIDSWRGAMIIAVVLFHVLGAEMCLEKFQVDQIAWIAEFISHFHMMVFFAISGFVWRKPKVDFKQYAIAKAARLMIPYYVFAIFSYFVVGAIILIIGSETRFSWIADLKAICVASAPSCNTPLWFLPVLFVILLTFYIIDRTVPRWALLLGAIAMSYFSKLSFDCLFKLHAFSIVLVPRYLMAFMLGAFLSFPFRRGGQNFIYQCCGGE